MEEKEDSLSQSATPHCSLQEYNVSYLHIDAMEWFMVDIICDVVGQWVLCVNWGYHSNLKLKRKPKEAVKKLL